MSAPPALRLLSLNIHMGRSMFRGREILPGLREAIRGVDADLVFLQEAVGEHRERSPAPQYEFLGDQVWGTQAYGRNAVYSEGHHGNAILSKHPLVDWVNHDISVARFEARGLLHATLAVPGYALAVHAVCVHLGLDAAERAEQIARLTVLVRDEIDPQAPLIVAGDFNDWRGRGDAQLGGAGLREAFRTLHGRLARTFPARLPLLPLDRVYLRGLMPVAGRVLSARPWSRLSDHAGLIVTVRP